jgi:hypothetical protein
MNEDSATVVCRLCACMCVFVCVYVCVCVCVYVCGMHADGWVGVFMHAWTSSGGNARRGGAGLHA